jgi:DNA-binding NarL/FixJ family response regulator
MRHPVRVVLADDHDAFVEGLGMVLSAEDDLEIVALAGDGASTLQAVRTHHPDVLVVDTEMPGPAVTELVRLIGQAEPGTRVLLLAEDPHPGPTGRADPDGPTGMSRAASARELADAIRAVAAGFRFVVADPPPPRQARQASPRSLKASPSPRQPPPRQASPRQPSPRQASPRQGSPPSRRPGAPEREGNRDAGGGLGTVHSPGHSPGLDLHAELLLRSLSVRERQVLGLLARGYSNRRIADACNLSLNTVRTHVQNVLVKLGVHSKLEAAALAVRQGLVRIEDSPA